MHVMKILYMASIYGLVKETRKQLKKKFTVVFTKNRCKTILKKNYCGFYGKPAAKTILYFYGLVTEIKNNLKKITAVFTKNRCKIILKKKLQRFLGKKPL
jgi:hypothetical protein